MAKVEFLGPIGLDPVEINVTNMKELSLVLNEMPRLGEWLDNSAVAVNNTIVYSLDFNIEQNDIITILPPVCGG
jgi:molybdopterin synthase sulfur carrier subunit